MMTSKELADKIVKLLREYPEWIEDGVYPLECVFDNFDHIASYREIETAVYFMDLHGMMKIVDNSAVKFPETKPTK
jgi:hypothetical protein